MTPFESDQTRRAPCAGGRRLDHRYPVGRGVDAGDVRTRQRGVVHNPIRRDVDTVRPAALWGVEHLQIARLRVQPPVHAVLPGEPVDAGPVEDGRIQVDVAARLGKRPLRHRLGRRVHPDDGVLTAVGEPGGAVGVKDHPVRGRVGPQRDQFDLAGLRVEPAEMSAALRGEPHGPIRCGIGPDVVSAETGRQRVFLDRDLGGGRRRSEHENEGDDQAVHRDLQRRRAGWFVVRLDSSVGWAHAGAPDAKQTVEGVLAAKTRTSTGGFQTPVSILDFGF